MNRVLGLAAASYLLVAASLSITTVPVAGYADGAPAGFAGGFKEPACDACHFDNDLNVKPGQLTLTGVPERFTPGQRYTLTVTLARPEMKIGGFQLTARMVDGGAQAGAFGDTLADAKRVRLSTFGPSFVQYVGQTREGSGSVQPGTLRWEVLWTAPATAAPVQFNVAANAADGDGSASGDFVYTAVSRSAGSP